MPTTYDALNRVTSRTDGDNVTTRMCYAFDNHVSATTLASQYAADGNVACGPNSDSFQYDLDGNEVENITHKGGTSAQNLKFYDGEDRLVEVFQRWDSRVIPNTSSYYDLYPWNWVTRYMYDDSQHAVVSVGSSPQFYAYGNLYKTVELLPSNPTVNINNGVGGAAWTDVRGTSFDAADRPIASYETAFGAGAKVTNTYDTNGYYGLLVSTQNAVGDASSRAYDNLNRVTSISFTGDGGLTPMRTYGFDPDGHETSAYSSLYGTMSTQYDADGRVTQVTEPGGGGLDSPATISYGYYPDGMRESLSVSSALVNQANAFTYSYTNEGELERQHELGPNESWVVPPYLVCMFTCETGAALQAE